MNPIEWLEVKLKKHYDFPTPYALSHKGWKDYKKSYQELHPIMYWIFEVFFWNIELYWSRWFKQPWENFWYGLRHRFISRETEVNIQTLSKYRYHDPCEVLLHANFQVLVDYVEYEVSVGERPKWFAIARNIPIIGYFVPLHRDSESGLKHLEWECNLINDENMGYDKGHEMYGELTSQATNDIIIRDLYLWWKDERPNRIDPMELSGMNKYLEMQRLKGKDVFDEKTEEESNDWKFHSDLNFKIEEDYEKEDEDNLHKLISIRQTLWT